MRGREETRRKKRKDYHEADWKLNIKSHALRLRFCITRRRVSLIHGTADTPTSSQ